MLSHANMLANAMGTGPLYHYTSTDRLLLSGPLFHLGTGSRVYTAVLYGTTMVIQSKFEVEAFMAIIEAQKVTTMTMVPTMFQMLLDHPRFPEFDFSSLRCLTYGSAPMPVALMQRLLDTVPGVTFCQGYGMTEAAPVICILTPEDHEQENGEVAKIASVGKPMRYCDLRIVDENDQPVAQGETGEIIVRGPQVMNGYWNRPQETAEAMRGGFYHTGDAAWFDEDGYVYLAGRTKEMIISGGENVYPIETENCLSKHPAIAACAVIGLPHEKWGEMVTAAVSLKPGQTASAEDIIEHCRAKIAHYKAPKKVVIWDDALPLNPANKIDKIRIKAAIMEQADD
jgi:acyl-CoA synthetase (AMP-forming)/AMP-acid ligase II